MFYRARKTSRQIEKKKDFDSSMITKLKFRIRMTYVKIHTKQKIDRKRRNEKKKIYATKELRSRKK